MWNPVDVSRCITLAVRSVDFLSWLACRQTLKIARTVNDSLIQCTCCASCQQRRRRCGETVGNWSDAASEAVRGPIHSVMYSLCFLPSPRLLHYTVSQKTGSLWFTGQASSKSTDVGNFWQRQLHFITSSAFVSNKFNAVENHLQFPWQRQQTTTCGCCGLTLNMRLSTKRSTSGEKDSRP